jgi:hypothetical protein
MFYPFHLPLITFFSFRAPLDGQEQLPRVESPLAGDSTGHQLPKVALRELAHHGVVWETRFNRGVFCPNFFHFFFLNKI